ncbi:RNA-directed DNA polymerase, eukaryota [Tanacetum coccineum]
MNTSISSFFRRHVRGGVESQQLDQLSLLLDTVILSNMDDRWFWDLNGDGVFQVKDVRFMLDEAFLPKMEVLTRWIKSIPIKVNVFAWKLYLDRFTSRSNLSRRNVRFRLWLVLFVITWSRISSIDHSVALWRKIFRSSRPKDVLEGVLYVSWWSPLNFRNQVIFAWIVVYAPQNLSSKITLWSLLTNLIANWDGILVVMGDFNEVREAGERFDRKGSKMSKLDRFLVSEIFYEVFPHITGAVLEKGTPDHRPILLKESNVDYGLTPFRFFHSWLELEGFHDLVTDTWNNDGIVEANASHKLRKDIQEQLYSIDVKIDQGCASEEDLEIRAESSTRLGADLLNHLSSDQSDFLKHPVSRDEIKRAVWDCGGDRAPSPDGFTFKFFTTFWDLIEEDVDFLDLVMEKLGFGLKWRSWIFGCFCNARSSVLVNRSPTPEFELFRGLRQGDPLSPFLFILAMEGLHALTCKVETLGLFKGASFGCNNLHISHLMYADDVIFFCEWSRTNAHNLICMLRCFFLISGLKINVHKSSVLGVSVSNEEVTNMASVIGFGVAKLPFKYLGVPVGCNMAKCANWSAIFQKFSSKLFLWKARLLSEVIRRTKDDVGEVEEVFGEQGFGWPWRLPRRGVESSQFDDLLAIIGNVVLTNHCDSWHWTLNVASGFSVASVRCLVDARTLDVDFNATRRGIDVGSILCPLCQEDVESVNHIFFSCETAKTLWDLFAIWWELDIPICANILEWYAWLDSLKVSNMKRSFIEGVGDAYGVLMEFPYVTPPKLGSSGMVTMGATSKYNNQDIGNDLKWTF